MRFLTFCLGLAVAWKPEPGCCDEPIPLLSAIRMQARSLEASSSALRPLDKLSPRPLAAPETLEITDWMGYTKVPGTLIRRRGTTSVLIVADDIDLSGGDFSWNRGNSAKHVILIADTVRLKKNFRLDLSSVTVSDKSAGSFTLVARKFVGEKNARFQITAQGERGLEIPARTETYTRQVPDPRPVRGRLGGGAVTPRTVPKTFTRVIPGRVEPGGMGGNVTIVLSEVESPLGIKTANNLPELTTVWNGHVTLNLTGGLRKPNGQQFVSGITTLPQAEKWLPANALSEWYARLLHHAVTEMQVLAIQRPKGYRSTLLKWMLRMDHIAVYKPAYKQPEYLTSLRTLQQLKEELFPQLWEADPIQVVLDGQVHTATPLVEGLTNSWWLPPTEVLMKPWISANGPRMGLLTVHPGAQLSVTLSMDLELRIDPRLAEEFQKQLEAAGAKYAGQFTNWKLIPGQIQLPGIRELQVHALNDTIRCELKMEGDNKTIGGLLVKLASREGLPMKLDWVYNKDDDYRGQPFQVNASFSRRVGSGLKLQGQTVQNTGTETVVLEYIQTALGYEVLNPAIRLAPGQQTELPMKAKAVPATGVVFQPSTQEELLQRFLIARANVVDQVRIVNQLASTHRNKLKWVEFQVIHGSGRNAIRTGTYRMNPADQGLTTLSLQFPRLEDSPVSILVEGTAIYTNRSRPFREKFSSRNVFLNNRIFE